MSSNYPITGKCSLISEHKFKVKLSCFSRISIEIFKSVPSKYDPKTKCWHFHMDHYELLYSKLKPLYPKVKITKLPSYVLNCYNAPKPDYSKIDLSTIDPVCCGALMPFQEQGVRFGISKNGRCFIGDDMGLGKTFQALAIASYYRTDWPLLIVTTASMKSVWHATIAEYLPSVSMMHLHCMNTKEDYIGDAQVLIVSYELMAISLEKLLNHNFGMVIIDESHNVKNYKTKRANAATRLVGKASRVVLLSGTPALSRPSELYSQLAMIDVGFFRSYTQYTKRYCDAKRTHFGWNASGSSNSEELEVVLNKHFMIRRRKDEVLKMLPNKSQQVVQLDVNLDSLSEKDKDYFNLLADQYNNEQNGVMKHAALLTLFTETAIIKIPSVCSYILKILETKTKFIVFAHHKKMLDAIESILVENNRKFIRIDGKTNLTNRNHYINTFQSDPEHQCALLSITTANSGITLTAARLVIFAELHWNPSTLSQAEGRAHRIGQDGVVSVKYLLASNTADDYIWPLLIQKQDILKKAGLCNETFKDIVEVIQESVPELNSSDDITFANISSAEISFWEDIEDDDAISNIKI